MSLAQYASSSNSTDSQTYEPIDVIVTTCGGKDMSRAAYRGGARVGMSSAEQRPPDEIPVEFVDWPFLEEDQPFDEKWTRHLDVVKRERPMYAVAPDIDDGRNYETVIPMADQLAEYADVVIVVPKTVKPDRVPSRFRVGVPAQDRFGGVPWPVWEYRNIESAHILGGSPHRQFELSHYLPVESVDTASPLKAAQFGSVWNGNWQEEGQNYYDRIELSMNNLVDEWNGPLVDENRINKNRLDVPIPQPCTIEDERKARPQSREDLCLKQSEEPPFPGREYFLREDTLTRREYKNEKLSQVR